MQSQTSLAFVLRRKPFRDNSLLLDVFTEQQGKMTCVVRYNKRQSSRIKAILDPFRLLEVTWRGSGQVMTVVTAEEKRRYPLKSGSLVKATYATEVLLRGLWEGQASVELFFFYRRLLWQLAHQDNPALLQQFEWLFLYEQGIAPNLETDDLTHQALQAQQVYRFQPQQGLFPQESHSMGIPISGHLLIALRNYEQLPETYWQESRQVLDQLIAIQLNGKALYSRRLI